MNLVQLHVPRKQDAEATPHLSLHPAAEVSHLPGTVSALLRREIPTKGGKRKPGFWISDALGLGGVFPA